MFNSIQPQRYKKVDKCSKLKLLKSKYYRIAIFFVVFPILMI